MSRNIYEDIENRVPALPNLVGIGGLRNDIGSRQGLCQIPLQKQNNGRGRTVLGSLNNVRVQPRRAAKQGVSYESGVPQHDLCDKENTTTSSYTKSFGSSSSLPFTIHDDSMSTSSNSSSISRSSSSGSSTASAMSLPLDLHTDFKFPPFKGLKVRSSNKDSSLFKDPFKDTFKDPFSNSSSSASTRQMRTDYDRHRSDTVIPTKEKSKARLSKIKDNAKENVDPNARAPLQSLDRNVPMDLARLSAPKAPLEIPEDMDLDASMSDSFSMTVDMPKTSPREDILKTRDNKIWDCPEYAQDIYNYVREAEICHKARANYMNKQTDITANMRWILVDWLVEVSEEYNLHTETLYLAVSYIDRFLSHMSVKRDKLQLVGTTAMFIASKYEEIYPPDVSQFAYITDNTYRVSQILRMEHLILKVLSFDMAVPTGHFFVNHFAKLCKCSEETLYLALFVCELSMLDCDPFLRYLPSLISAASIALANYTQGKTPWPEHMEQSSRYSLSDLKECYVNLYRVYCRIHEPQQHAIRDKYKASKFHGVSNLSPREGFPWGKA